ncbi:ATP-binding protein [Candidatus Nitrospira bockiana]
MLRKDVSNKTVFGWRAGPRSAGFISLRTKLVLFISLIVVFVCSGLSWYFIRQQEEMMRTALIETGSILVRNLAHNSRYAVITEDRVDLEQYIDGVMADEEVVYAVITGADGQVLARATRGVVADDRPLVRANETALYPAPALAEAAFKAGSAEPIITPFVAVGGERTETVYDFAVPILRRTAQTAPAMPLPFSLEQLERTPRGELKESGPPKVLSVAQIGLTGARMQQTLDRVVRNVMLITSLIILIGIAGTVVLADRIITPLKRLAAVAKRVAEGDLDASEQPRTRDEVGELTVLFNQMTQVLKERDRAITSQLMQLQTLNRAGAAIISTLDTDKLIETVLRLLVENLGYRRMLLMLYDPHRGVAFGARVAGASSKANETMARVEIPVVDDGSLHAQLLLQGRALFIEDLEAAAPRIHPPILELARQEGVRCFVAAPLKSSQRILGFIGADRGEEPCRPEDLDLLVTIASQIAVAIDNAQAYQDLENLTQTLEQRVQDRTRELQAANEQLQELDRLKSAFVSIVSHELRTPMTSIKGYVENMLDGLTGALTDRQAYYLGRVKFNVERLTRMINDLLDLSRIEAGRVELSLTRIPVADLVVDISESLHPVAQAKAVILETRHSGPPVVMLGDRDKLHQILTNLIQNAVKFTPQGGEITLETRAENGFVLFCVADTGCGIPLHEQPKIFERFYRGEHVLVEQRGAGLGLAITKSLVELQGGKIWVESTPGQGSKFFFTIPIATERDVLGES